jgi:hypothetical protein
MTLDKIAKFVLKAFIIISVSVVGIWIAPFLFVLLFLHQGGGTW